MKVFFTILLIFINSFVFSQDTYVRKQNEKADVFIKRVFPQIKFNDIVSGNWGDTTLKYKIMGFYSDTIDHGEKAIILQLISKNKFKKLKFDFSFGVGWGDTKIASVFFFDVDKNGIKEMVILGSGTGRCDIEIDDYDEELQKEIKRKSTALCELCGYMVFEQKIKSDAIDLLTSSAEGIDQANETCNAEFIKRLLTQKKNK